MRPPRNAPLFIRKPRQYLPPRSVDSLRQQIPVPTQLECSKPAAVISRDELNLPKALRLRTYPQNRPVTPRRDRHRELKPTPNPTSAPATALPTHQSLTQTPATRQTPLPPSECRVWLGRQLALELFSSPQNPSSIKSNASGASTAALNRSFWIRTCPPMSYPPKPGVRTTGASPVNNFQITSPQASAKSPSPATCCAEPANQAQIIQSHKTTSSCL